MGAIIFAIERLIPEKVCSLLKKYRIASIDVKSD
jgi:hypothetical protein